MRLVFVFLFFAAFSALLAQGFRPSHRALRLEKVHNIYGKAVRAIWSAAPSAIGHHLQHNKYAGLCGW